MVNRVWWVFFGYLLLMLLPMSSNRNLHAGLQSGETLTPPEDLSGAALGQTQIEWTWTDGVGETHYELRDLGGSVIAFIAADATVFLETGLTPNTEFCRRIVGVQGSLEAESSSACATTLSEPEPPAFSIVLAPDERIVVSGATTSMQMVALDDDGLISSSFSQTILLETSDPLATIPGSVVFPGSGNVDIGTMQFLTPGPQSVTARALDNTIVGEVFLEVVPDPLAGPTPTRLGDVDGDGDITANDASLVSGFLGGLNTLSPLQGYAADVNQDTRIEQADVDEIILLQGQPAMGSAPVISFTNISGGDSLDRTAIAIDLKVNDKDHVKESIFVFGSRPITIGGTLQPGGNLFDFLPGVVDFKGAKKISISPGANAFPIGSNAVVAAVTDESGNIGVTSVSFNVEGVQITRLANLEEDFPALLVGRASGGLTSAQFSWQNLDGIGTFTDNTTLITNYIPTELGGIDAGMVSVRLGTEIGNRLFFDVGSGQAQAQEKPKIDDIVPATKVTQAGQELTIFLFFRNPNTDCFDVVSVCVTVMVVKTPPGVKPGDVKLPGKLTFTKKPASGKVQFHDGDLKITFPKPGLYVIKLTYEATITNKKTGVTAKLMSDRSLGIPVGPDGDGDGVSDTYQQLIDDNFKALQAAAKKIPELDATIKAFEMLRDPDRPRFAYDQEVDGGDLGGKTDGPTKAANMWGRTFTIITPLALQSEAKKLETMIHEMRHAFNRKQVNDNAAKSGMNEDVNCDGLKDKLAQPGKTEEDVTDEWAKKIMQDAEIQKLIK